MNKIEYGTEFLDQLKDRVHDLYDENKELKKEIERLNNIINKIEEILKDHIDECRKELNMIKKTEDLDYVNECSTQFVVIRKNIEMIMEKIEKLKGDDKDDK